MAPGIDDGSNWLEYRQLILSELKRIGSAVDEVDKKVDRLRNDDISSIKVEVAMLQVKSGMWGGGAGLLVAVAAVLMKYVGG